jgi:hypothetical protein
MKQKKIFLCLFLFLFFPAYSIFSLSDITGHWAEKNIRRLVEMGAIAGYPDGTFKPNINISRAEVITIIVKSLKLEDVEISNYNFPYIDVPEQHWAYKFILIGSAKGILQEETKFRPKDMATRAEIASMIINAMGKKTQAKALTLDPNFPQYINFKDISPKDSYSGYIALASKEKIVEGYQDGTFKPNKNVTRAEATTMIVRMLDKISGKEFGALRRGSKEGYTGVIIDCRGMKISESQSPKIYDTEGNIIYGVMSTLPPEELGVVGYYNDIEKAKERAGDNPLIVTALEIKNQGDIPIYPVISKEDALKIKEENKKSKFLERWSVAIVK